MKRILIWMLGLAAWCGAGLATASFHTFQITEIYSNADGTIQYVVLREQTGLNGEDLWAGQRLTVTHAGRAKTYAFPRNLPSTFTANRYVLIATQGYVDASASASEFSFVTPDFVVPNQFFPTDAGSINYAGVDDVSYGSLPTDGDRALYVPPSSAEFVDRNVARNFAGAVASMPALAVTAVEYYNAVLDHYFISNLQPDIDALDSGRIPGWVRTRESFFVYAAPSTFLNPVCRFYIPPQHGNSHFFSASPEECASISDRIGFDPNYSGYILETSAAFYLELPNTSTGACRAGTTPVYRLWNNRADSNHRYTTSLAVKAQMVANGYTPEGYGRDAVAMCAPT